MKNHATKHSLDRMKDRLDVNKRKAEKQISDALKRGKPAEAFSSKERSFLAKKACDGCTALAYNGFCYIINADNVCVTLYPLPAWFGKKKHFDGKEKIRNPKKYDKYYLAQKRLSYSYNFVNNSFTYSRT